MTFRCVHELIGFSFFPHEFNFFVDRNIVELQHANQKLDKLVREMQAQNDNNNEDLNRTRFDELKKEHQQQQEKLKETRTQLDLLETQVLFLLKNKKDKEQICF